MNRPLLTLLCGILGGQVVSVAAAALQKEDIIVAPQAVPEGDTHHGYCEFRVLLENQSSKETHRVTLIFPEHAWNWGNSIGSISRTVALAPNSRSVVPFWQPPLPANDNSAVRVLVDGDNAGSVNLPNSRRHVTGSGHRG